MPNRSPARKPVNLSINADLLDEAKALNVNLSRAADAGLAQAVRAEKERLWLEENREALESWKVWVEQNGLPLAKYRMF